GPDDVFLSVPNVHTVTEGETVSRIYCSVDCWPACVFTWINVTNGEPISNSEALAFGTVSRYDAGIYKCLVRNFAASQFSREARNQFSLRVQYGPDDVTLSVPNVHTVTEGDTVSRIYCSVDCWPACVFTWINVTNSEPISNSETLAFG
ncbi:VCAM1-like protein, partial [Mya arenaria]